MGGKLMPLEVSGVKLYNVEEIAKMFKCSKVIIRTYCKEGKIKGRKMLAKWYVTEDNLKKYINEDYPISHK